MKTNIMDNNLKNKNLTGQSDVDIVVAMPRQPVAMICKIRHVKTFETSRCRFAAGFRRISRLGSFFITLRCVQSAQICFQVTSL